MIPGKVNQSLRALDKSMPVFYVQSARVETISGQ